MGLQRRFHFKNNQKLSQKLNGLLGLWVGISFSGLLIWNGIVGMPSQISSCNTPYPGNEAVISLSPGDTLCIPAGEVFTGRLEKLPKGALIRVNAQAVFQPIALWNAKGSIDNHGLIVFEDLVNAQDLSIDNKGKINLKHNLGKKANLNILNRLGASINSFSNVTELNSQIKIENYGDVYFEGKIRIGEKVKIENNGRINFEEFSSLNGDISNFGIIQAYEKLLISRQARIQNHCSFIAPNSREFSDISFKNDGITLNQAGDKLEEELDKYACYPRFSEVNPVVLQYFRPKIQEELAVIRWQIDLGSKASFFELERSFDKDNFESLDRIDVEGKEHSTFEYIDSKLFGEQKSDQVYYRLKMTNLQGVENYGPTIQLSLDDTEGLGMRLEQYDENALYLSYSNPKNEKLDLQIKHKGGELVKQVEIAPDRALNEVLLDLKEFPSGDYEVVLSNDESFKMETIHIARD